MNTTREPTVAEDEEHQLDMLLWQADVHEGHGRNQEAFEIRAWVTDFLSLNRRNLNEI
jgi:uncharacterized alpha-E superfamily protein